MRLLIFITPIIFLSCSSYKKLEHDYSFSSATHKPEYDKLDYWAAHPWKKDPSDSLPASLNKEYHDSTTDVFFIHPTTFTKKNKKEILNADIDDPYINAKTDYTAILYQASAFNEQSRVFAPRYRQAHLYNFFKKDKAEATAAFDVAYEDVRNAFRYYLDHYNQGRPIIIAAHSQGSFLAEKLLAEFFDDKPLRNKLVVAYIVGWPLRENYFKTIPHCIDSNKTGCVCSWRTLRKNFIPPYLVNTGANVIVTNPLNWTTGTTYAPRSMNKGSVLRNFSKIYPNTTDAQVENGFLFVHKPRFPGSFLFMKRNYHIGDINLYYMNVRADVKRRIGLFWKE